MVGALAICQVKVRFFPFGNDSSIRLRLHFCAVDFAQPDAALSRDQSMNWEQFSTEDQTTVGILDILRAFRPTGLDPRVCPNCD